MTSVSPEATPLLDLVLERIDQSALQGTAQLLVLAAFEGQAQLEQALEGVLHGQRPAPVDRTPVDVPRTYLTSVGVTGFRGIGPHAALRLQPGPGLTLVVGRNGSGKSSFAEALEMALTGDNARWAGRGAVWREGWRNLHLPDGDPTVTVELAVDGEAGSTKVVRSWPGADVESSTGWYQRPGHPRESIDRLGWEQSLQTFRPFLSYSELGSMLLGRPSDLYDALFSILGLEELSSAQQRLKAAAKELDERAKALAAQQRQLAAAVADIDDDRAREVAAVLRSRTPDLTALRRVLEATPTEHQDLAPLRRWTQAQTPDPRRTADAADHLVSAAAQTAQVADTSSGQAQALASLLGQALQHVRHADSADCPVCGSTGTLTDDWRAATERHVERLRGEAAEADAAVQALRQAWALVEQVATRPPSALLASPDESWREVAQMWQDWADAACGGDVAASVRALRERTGVLAAQVLAVQQQADAELVRREDLWQPLAGRAAAFLAEALLVAAQADARTQVKQASEWLKAQADGLRDDRLAPLAEQAGQLWASLRQESNVDLGPITLEGSATRRRVTLDVTVDGVEGAALGVMSQGELHALALSLFLPRAMLPDSPFRFLVIDDPVQAMDPSKVDGLARVLQDVASTHQVVVFTHDDRLPEAVRRLQLPATIWQTVRREGSVVELQKTADPVTRYLEDARALTKSTELPEAVLGRVVPGLCRSALEATCHERVRRHRLHGGALHADVERAIATARTTNQAFALALFDDSSKGGDVLRHLNSYGPWAADAFQAVRRGVHERYTGDLAVLVKDTEKLVERLRR